jgi:RluA family pseudouridine synthase
LQNLHKYIMLARVMFDAQRARFPQLPHRNSGREKFLMPRRDLEAWIRKQIALKQETIRPTDQPYGAPQAAFDMLSHFNDFVVFEDDHLLVLNKPAGILSHMNSEKDDPAILDVARYQRSDSPRLALAHRLDRLTSGLLVFTKTGEAHSGMTDQFGNKAKSDMKKKYIALVDGEWKGNKAEKVEVGISPNPQHPKLMQAEPLDSAIISPFVKSAVSYFTPIAVLDKRRGATADHRVTLMEVQIVTGRTHQIRVTAQFKGHPIVGDRQYHGSRLTDRPMLHAAELEFTHPVTKERIHLKAPIPSDFLEGVNAHAQWIW